MHRFHWNDLPSTARHAVELRTGPVLSTSPAPSGILALTVHTATTSVFLKGVPDDYRQVHTHNREATVNPWLPPSCPRLKWRARAGGWDLLGYAPLDGHPADLTPGSPDLPLTARALEELQNWPCPPVELRRAERRWGGHVQNGDPQLLAGETLLHTLLTPDDLLVTARRTHLVGWSQPTRGAAWIDPALLILRLMDAGHTARDADLWARAHFPSWATAPGTAVAVFSEANSRVWQLIAGDDPTEPNERMARSAREWARYWRP